LHDQDDKEVQEGGMVLGMQGQGREKPRVSTHHDDVPMGKIDEAEDAVDHGIAQRDEGVNGPHGHAVQDLLKKTFQNFSFNKRSLRGVVAEWAIVYDVATSV